LISLAGVRQVLVVFVFCQMELSGVTADLVRFGIPTKFSKTGTHPVEQNQGHQIVANRHR
jgi:hypothetical protein